MCAVFSLFLSVFSCYLTIDFFLFRKKIEIGFFDKLYGVNERNNNLALVIQFL